MGTRRLALRREPLTALAADDLANVAGAAAYTLPSPQCLTVLCGAPGPSVLPCVTTLCTT
jgi:hypothetical protein